MNRLILLVIPLILLYGDIPFKEDEILNYTAYFSGVKAAKGKLKVLKKERLNNIMSYHVQFTAKSIGLANHLFPINDKIDLWLSEDSLHTIKALYDIQEGNYKYKREIVMDYSTGFAYSNKDSLLIKNIVHSPYALFYYFRMMDLTKLRGKIINTIQKKQVTQLEILIKEHVNVNVPAGNFLCTEVIPINKSKKQFKNDAKMSILFSDDDYKYPVIIKLKLKFGSLVLKLDEISS